MHSLSTRTATTNRLGLAAGLKELAPLAPPGIMLECLGDPGSLPEARRVLRQAGRPVVAVLGPLVSGSPAGGLPTVETPDETVRARVLARLRATLPALKGMRCRRFLVQTDEGEVEPERARGADARESSQGDGSEAPGGLGSVGRESAAERVCRSLHALVRAATGVRLLLLPGPGTALDPESAGWVLDDLRPYDVGLALDLGTLGLRECRGGPTLEGWLDAHARRTDLFLLSDHDGRNRCDLLPGAGVLDFSRLAGWLDRRTLRVLRPDPSGELAGLLAADSFLRDRLGTPPDPLA